MKRAKQQFIFSLAILLLLCACDNNLLSGKLNDNFNNPSSVSDEAETSQSLPGTGGVLITFSSEDFQLGDSLEDARTILPGTPTLTRYKLVFYEKDSTNIISGLGGNFDSSLPVNVTIPIGDYDLVVYGYESETYLSSDYYSAMGKANNIEIKEGNSTSVGVALKIIDDEGTGAFVYTITYPGSTAQITIDPLGVKSNESPQKTISPITSGQIGSVTLNSGYYRIIIEAENGGKKAIRSEVLHIYQNLTSTVTHKFDESDFFAALTGSVTITGYPVPEEILTANVTGSNAASDDITYIWYSGGVFESTGSSYTVKESDLTKTISVTALSAGYNGSLSENKIIVAFEGDGTDPSNYLIRNEWQLRYLAAQVNNAATTAAYNSKYYRLENGIKLEQGNWIPIGAIESRAFSGTFDGNGKTVSNLINNDTSIEADAFGFFGVINNLGWVFNLHVVIGDIGITHQKRIGGIAGYLNRASVEGCAVTGGDIIGVNGYAGGIAGEVHDGGIIDSYSTINVTSNSCAGGIVGYSTDSVSITMIQYCYATGIITGNIAGGIIGSDNGFELSVLNYCVALNTEITGVYTGRIVGQQNGDTEFYNKARSDMLVNGLLVTGGDIENKDGEDVIVDAGISLTSIFHETNWSRTVWEIPAGALIKDCKLPTLKSISSVTQDPRLPAAAVANTVTVSKDSAAAVGYINLTAALASITTGGTYTVTLLADQTLGETTLNTADAYITLIGDTSERVIQFLAVVVDEYEDPIPTLILLNNVQLKLENNITIKGISTGAHASLIRTRGSSLLIMEGGSKITGHSSSGNGVIDINQTNSRFIMNGGEISGNSTTSPVSIGTGGIYATNGSITIKGGKIINNTRQDALLSDIVISQNCSGKFSLSGSPQIGVIWLTAYSSSPGTVIAGNITVDNFNGIVSSLNLIGISDIPIESVKSYWENRQVIIPASGQTLNNTIINRFPLGRFYSMYINNTDRIPQSISDTHYLETTGTDIGKLLPKTVQSGITIEIKTPQEWTLITDPEITIDVNTPTNFTVASAYDTPGYSYQWYLNGTAILGATAADYTFTSSTPGIFELVVDVKKDGESRSGRYRVTVLR